MSDSADEDSCSEACLSNPVMYCFVSVKILKRYTISTKKDKGMEKKLQKNMQNDEIDLLQLFMMLKSHLLMILAVGLLTGLLSGLYTHFLIQPTYEATSNMLILTKETTLASIADLEIGVKLTGDYTELITSRTVLEKVIANLGLDVEYTNLRNNITITNPSSTRILKITVSQNDPLMAKKVADELANVSADFIADQMEVAPPKIYETSEVPIYKASPSLKKNVMMGVLAGMVLVCGILVVLELMDDSIQTEEDVQRYLEIPVLAVVPDKGIKAKKRRSSASAKNNKEGR